MPQDGPAGLGELALLVTLALLVQMEERVLLARQELRQIRVRLGELGQAVLPATLVPQE